MIEKNIDIPDTDLLISFINKHLAENLDLNEYRKNKFKGERIAVISLFWKDNPIESNKATFDVLVNCLAKASGIYRWDYGSDEHHIDSLSRWIRIQNNKPDRELLELLRDMALKAKKIDSMYDKCKDPNCCRQIARTAMRTANSMIHAMIR